MIETFNFVMTSQFPDRPKDKDNCFIDYRNGIKCYEMNPNGECYFNYLRLLNSMRDKWKSYGYLDLGMIPAAMGPTFMHRSLLNQISEALGRKGVKAYYLPSVSFMSSDVKLGSQDIWVFREDAEKAMGKSKVTTEEFIRWCIGQ